MGLKKATVTDFVDRYGAKQSFDLNIESVVFEYINLEVVIKFQIVPADYIEGMPLKRVIMRFPIDLSDQDILGLVMGTSEKLWELIPDQEVLDTFEMDGEELVPVRKTLTDVGATITDV